MEYKHYRSAALACLVVLSSSLYVSVASASEVTGSLSSAGVFSSQTGTTGTLEGTVSSPVVAVASAGGSGGGGPVSGPFAFGFQNSNGNFNVPTTNGVSTGSNGTPTATGATNIPGSVLGASTDIPNSFVTETVASPEDQGSLAFANGTVSPTPNIALAAATASGVGLGFWLWMLLLVLVLIGIGVYAYNRYYARDHITNRY